MEVDLNAEIAENAEEEEFLQVKTRDELNEITGPIIEYSIKVHSALGPGMLLKARMRSVDARAD